MIEVWFGVRKRRRKRRRGKEAEEDGGSKRPVEERPCNAAFSDDAGPVSWCLGAHFCSCTEKKLKVRGEPAGRAQSFQSSSWYSHLGTGTWGNIDGDPKVPDWALGLPKGTYFSKAGVLEETVVSHPNFEIILKTLCLYVSLLSWGEERELSLERQDLKHLLKHRSEPGFPKASLSGSVRVALHLLCPDYNRRGTAST